MTSSATTRPCSASSRGVHTDLRSRSAEALQAIGFDGYAIGGLAVGEPEHERNAMLDHRTRSCQATVRAI